MSSCCPLCGGRELAPVATLDTSVTAREYRRVFGIEVSCSSASQSLERCQRCDLAFFTPPSPGDERFYQDLQRIPWYYQSDKPEHQVAATHITRGDAVLEVGGGQGAFGSLLACRDYRMLELNSVAAGVARERGLDARHDSIEAHAAGHPQAYDVVCAFQVLEHVASPRDFLVASLRCLRPGGRLVLSVPADESFMGRQRHNLLNLPPHHLTRWTERSLASLAGLFDLTLVALHREALAPAHVRTYASNAVDRLLAAAMLRPWHPLDPVLVTAPVRAARALLSCLPYPLVRLARERIRGHTTIAVYRSR